MFLGAFGDGTSQKLLSDGDGVASAGVGKIEAEKLKKTLKGFKKFKSNSALRDLIEIFSSFRKSAMLM